MTRIPAQKRALPPIRFASAADSFRSAVLAGLSSDPDADSTASAQRRKTLTLLLAGAALFALQVSGLLQGDWLFVCVALSQPLYLIAAIGVAHDASHGAFPERSWLGRHGIHVFDSLGVSSYIWHFDHVRAHHCAPNVSHYDANLTAWGLRLDPRRPLSWYHAYQHFYAPFIYSLASLHKVFVADFVAFARTRAHLPSKHPRREVLRLVVWKTIAISFTLALPLSMNADVAAVALGYVIGHLFSGLLMGAIFQPTHTNEYVRWPKADAEGRLLDSFEQHTLATTADFCVDSSWITWITGGLNIHAVHHMFPRLSHLALPRASQLVAEMAPLHGLSYLTFQTWPTAIRSHLRALARLGRVAPEDVPAGGDIFALERGAQPGAVPSQGQAGRLRVAEGA